jgi:DNA invertase Pin-like site-specific DNA recombinase
MLELNPPLGPPKNGRKLNVLGICRISTINQDQKSLADQEAMYRHRIESWTKLPYEMHVLASQGSGQNLARPDYLNAIELVESGAFDLVITEDLSRICRRVQAHMFCETCEDAKTRLIAINDHIDTARPGWEMHSYFAIMRHGTYNKDVSERIKRTQRNRFTQGGIIQFVIFGYIKPTGAKHEKELRKDPSAGPIYDKWFAMLEAGADYSEVGDWLNSLKIPTGPYSRSRRWTGKMVKRITFNPILKGRRERNNKVSKFINNPGKYVSVDAPPDAKLERECPHLEFIEPGRYDRLIAKLKNRKKWCTRKGQDGIDPRKDVSRKRTVWPGQHLRCDVCGRLVYWYGVGNKKTMKCSGNQAYQCWVGGEFNGKVAADKLSAAIFREIMDLPNFDPALIETVRKQWRESNAEVMNQKKELVRRRQELESRVANVTDAIASGGQIASLVKKLQDLESEQTDLGFRIADLESALPAEPNLPCVDELKKLAAAVFTEFAPANQEIGRLMKVLVPDLRVYPVRLCDGGKIVFRAELQLNLTAFMSEPWNGPPEILTRRLVVDLFDPPQREQFREKVMRMRASGLTEAPIAKELGITKAAVQRAASLQRMMDRVGLTDPYIRVVEPPADAGWSRHLHPRYRFEPLDRSQGS